MPARIRPAAGWAVGKSAVRLDYSYMGFGTQRVMLANPLDGVPAPFDIKHNLQTLMVGVNYKFGQTLF
jgi:opacity protein-like surface antigen